MVVMAPSPSATISEVSEHSIDFTYGWNSEDDLHFPTRGSALQLALSLDVATSEQEIYGNIKFRKTWKAAGGYWSVAFGSQPANEYREEQAPLDGLASENPRLGILDATIIHVDAARFHEAPCLGFRRRQLQARDQIDHADALGIERRHREARLTARPRTPPAHRPR